MQYVRETHNASSQDQDKSAWSVPRPQIRSPEMLGYTDTHYRPHSLSFGLPKERETDTRVPDQGTRVFVTVLVS